MTNPDALTVATVGLLERHVTVVASVPSAVTVLASCWELLMNIDAVVGETVTLRMTGTTLIVAMPLSSVSATETAVMVVVPNATPVTTPD